MVLYSFFSGGVLHHLLFVPIYLKRKSQWKVEYFWMFFLEHSDQSLYHRSGHQWACGWVSTTIELPSISSLSRQVDLSYFARKYDLSPSTFRMDSIFASRWRTCWNTTIKIKRLTHCGLSVTGTIAGANTSCWSWHFAVANLHWTALPFQYLWILVEFDKLRLFWYCIIVYSDICIRSQDPNNSSDTETRCLV